jgi:signal transduction histidine kinase
VGLWIVRRVVEAHGGSIAVESRLGEGASFIVQLPLRDPPPSQPERLREKDPEGPPSAFH